MRKMELSDVEAMIATIKDKAVERIVDETQTRVAQMTLAQWIDHEIETFYAMDFLADYEKMTQVKLLLETLQHRLAARQDARPIIEMIAEMGDDFEPEDLESAVSLANSWIEKYPDPEAEQQRFAETDGTTL